MKVFCGHYGQSHSSPFFEPTNGCGYGSEGDWDIDKPQELTCPKCANHLDEGAVNLAWPGIQKEKLGEIGSGFQIFTLSDRPQEPYFSG